jgi:NH3-dependent NAD+ synthetase
MPVLNVKTLIENRVGAIREMHQSANIFKAELDLSGGIDSAVMACLLVLALGPEHVILTHSRFRTDGKQTDRAVRLAKALGVPLVNGDFGKAYDAVLNTIVDGLIEAGVDIHEVMARMQADPTIEGSIRSTLRAPIGRAVNRLFGGGIRHGTGNECEDRFLRFYQKGGDGEVDSNPIEMLSKTEVYQLAWGLGEMLGEAVRDVLREIIRALPSPDLWGQGDKHNDEDELFRWTGAPFTYGRIDPITGEILRYGTIERVSRFLDRTFELEDGTKATGEKLLFDDLDRQSTMREALRNARTYCFPEMTRDEVLTLLRAARRAEQVTRHKWNPNCPMLGNRADLVADGILSNELPALAVPTSRPVEETTV